MSLPDFPSAELPNRELFKTYLARIAEVDIEAAIYFAGFRTQVEATLTAVQSEGEQWQDLATQNPVTGMLNRLGLERHVTRARQELPDTPFGVIAADLGGFKGINDTLGHPEGDKILREVAGLFRATDYLGTFARPGTDTISHPGGDEFLIVAPLVADPGNERRNTDLSPQERLDGILRRTRQIGPDLCARDPRLAQLVFSVAAGGTILEPSEPFAAAEFRADAAMYVDKRSQRRPLTESQLGHLASAGWHAKEAGIDPRALAAYLADLGWYEGIAKS